MVMTKLREELSQISDVQKNNFQPRNWLTFFKFSSQNSVKSNKMSPISTAFFVAFTLNFLISEPGVYGAPACNVICTLEFTPICGSDGKTYDNLCLLNAKNQCDGTAINKTYNGECQLTGTPCPSDVCSMEYAPVCGSDGQTYNNACELKVKNACGGAGNGVAVNIAHDGLCESSGIEGTCTSHEETPIVCGCPCAIRCSNEYIPLCGTDGKTYRNPCQLAVANSCVEYPVRKCYDGECRS